MKIIAEEKEIKEQIRKALEQHINLITTGIMERLKKIEDREKAENV